jgi:hypothetical protein
MMAISSEDSFAYRLVRSRNSDVSLELIRIPFQISDFPFPIYSEEAHAAGWDDDAVTVF